MTYFGDDGEVFELDFPRYTLVRGEYLLTDPLPEYNWTTGLTLQRIRFGSAVTSAQEYAMERLSRAGVIDISDVIFPGSMKFVDLACLPGNNITNLQLNEGVEELDYTDSTSVRITVHNMWLPASLKRIGREIFAPVNGHIYINATDVSGYEYGWFGVEQYGEWVFPNQYDRKFYVVNESVKAQMLNQMVQCGLLGSLDEAEAYMQIEVGGFANVI